MKIGHITINSHAKMRPLVTTRNEEGKIVFKNIMQRITDELEECISSAVANGLVDAKNIPVQDVITTVVKKLDQMRGLYRESFRYEYSKNGDKVKFTLFWN